jgi:RimJ/RimL family protein N-acetyltransferase
MPALPETIQTERLALSADHWNKGMITEAVRAVCDCAFENVAELNRIRG